MRRNPDVKIPGQESDRPVCACLLAEQHCYWLPNINIKMCDEDDAALFVDNASVLFCWK